jgi:hypothetical protein
MLLLELLNAGILWLPSLIVCNMLWDNTVTKLIRKAHLQGLLSSEDLSCG